MTRLLLPIVLAAGLLRIHAADASDAMKTGMQAARCLTAASATYQVPLGALLILLQVEGGSLGHVSHNTNATVDIGPMQINSIWISKVAIHWRSTGSATYSALRDSFCANVDAGTWILRQSLDEAHGDLWNGVGLYHSHDPRYKADYLRKVLKIALRLEANAGPSRDMAANVNIIGN